MISVILDKTSSDEELLALEEKLGENQKPFA